MTVLKVVTADDERPARQFLGGLLKTCANVQLIGEAASGEEAIALIESERPHLALLDLQMPEIGGLDVVRRVSRDVLPLVAFVTAFDDYAIEAFELNAIDYLLKPVERHRLEETLARARERIRSSEPADERAAALESTSVAFERAVRRRYADRIPVRVRDEVLILPVRRIASIVADGELLHITTSTGDRHTITHRLHALESRLDPRKFVRLGRGTLANIDMVTRVSPMPGGTYLAILSNGQELHVSRIQSRALRETLLKL